MKRTLPVAKSGFWFPTHFGYICVEKRSYIFVLGTESARTESEEKANLLSESLLIFV